MKRLKSRKCALVLAVSCMAFTALASGTSTQDEYLTEEELYLEDDVQTIRVSDPLEPINRLTFKFNDFVYLKIVEPISNVYTAVTPDPVQEGASNFFYNLKYPVRLVGNLLQGRLNGAWVETGRFVVNSTVGVVGIFTPADRLSGFGPIAPEDIGQALGSWGIGEGPYLVLPLFGPSNLRDLGGSIGDNAVNPIREPFSVIDDWDWEWRIAIGATEFVVTSPYFIKRYKQMKGSAFDPYGSLKNAYTQSRRAAVEE